MLADKEALEQQLVDLKNQYSGIESDKESDTRRSELLQSRFDALQALHDAHESSFENERKDLNQQINALQAELNSLQNTDPSADLNQIKSDHDAQLSALEASRAELQTRLLNH